MEKPLPTPRKAANHTKPKENNSEARREKKKIDGITNQPPKGGFNPISIRLHRSAQPAKISNLLRTKATYLLAYAKHDDN